MASESEFLSTLVDRLDHLTGRMEAIFGPEKEAPFDDSVFAYRWRVKNAKGRLEPVTSPHRIALEGLVGIARQSETLDFNTRQFLAGLPCNNALLWGARGTGKSSLVKAMLNRYADDGLRLVEVDAHDLIDLPTLVEPLVERKERYILFVDDLSFEADDPSYRTLKAALDGSIAVAPENVLIYATSNRRHIVPEFQTDNEQTRLVGGELHHGEAVEEKISLSERFGIWLSFHPFSQDLYLEAVTHWLGVYGNLSLDDEARGEALKWALTRGNRSGRVAAQFAKDWAGRSKL